MSKHRPSMIITGFFVQRLLKWFYISVGWIAVVLGLITLWLPIPLGIPLFLVGVPLLMRYSPSARRAIMRLASRYPKIESLLNRLPASKHQE